MSLTDSEFILEAEKRYTFDAEFRARAHASVGVACTAIKSRTGIEVDEPTQKDMYLVASLALTMVDINVATGDWITPPPPHDDFPTFGG